MLGGIRMGMDRRYNGAGYGRESDMKVGWDWLDTFKVQLHLVRH